MLALNESYLYGKHQLKNGFAEINSLWFCVQAGEIELNFQGDERDQIVNEICAIWNSGDYQVSEAIEEWLFRYF